MYVQRKKKRKALVSDTTLLVDKGQAMGGYKEVEAEIREEMLRSKKRILRCSKYGQEGHTCRTCRV
jgi:hypothetical protein